MTNDPFTRPVPTLAEQTAQTARDVDEVRGNPGRYFRLGTPSHERLAKEAVMPEYDPLTGANWDQAAATAAWSKSMNRSGPRWNLRGLLGSWRWTFFNFGTWTGSVVIEAGVTTSLYEAFQSVEQNKTVKYVAG